jgi:16S rRNA (cytidine1402-2'-O)-methyltransferase
MRRTPLVGPSALLLALMASGLNGQRFRFHGYLPVDAASREPRASAAWNAIRARKR